MIDNIIDTVAYGLVLVGLILISGGLFVNKLPGAEKGSNKLKVEKTQLASIGFLLLFISFILLIIATWVA
jgi:hypothetical protein